MQMIGSLFENKTDRYLRTDKYFNPMYSPDNLFKFLRSSSELKYLKKVLNQKTSNIFKLFKRLSLCSLLIIHSTRFYELVGELHPITTGNKWVDEEFIEPYYRFLKKISCSSEMYELMKKHSPLKGEKNMELVFYDISMLKMVFTIVNKMPLLGRYYKDKSEVACSNFINTLAVQAQRIYVSLRVLLCHVIENAKVYLPTRQHEMIMKAILREELPVINQEMKKLFLDKYFYPLGKGIGLKLFKPQEQSTENSKTINGIINDHEETNRKKEKYQLEVTLFPQAGRVNMKFYEQSLMMSLNKIEGEKQYEEEVADIDVDVDVGYRAEDKTEYNLGGEKQTDFKNQSEIDTGIQRQDIKGEEGEEI